MNAQLVPGETMQQKVRRRDAIHNQLLKLPNITIATYV
jgi:hypothetical protein